MIIIKFLCLNDIRAKRIESRFVKIAIFCCVVNLIYASPLDSKNDIAKSVNILDSKSSKKILILAENSTQDSKENIESNADSKADSKEKTKSKSYRLNAVTATTGGVIGTFQNTAGSLSQENIESSPSGNGDITSLLRLLPNVQYDTQQLSSKTPGEINPADISISGGLYYQNNFQLDGFNMNNDLNPTGNNGNLVGRDALPGQSQGFNIDTSILDSINVQDSNISAAFSGFTGGVIEANTKRATKKFGANVSYQITQGNARLNQPSMTQYHVYGSQYDALINSTSLNNQPQFIKHLFKSSFESKFSENAGIVASFTTTQSFIPLNAYAGNQIDTTLDSKQKTQKRQSYNFYLKGHYDIGENLRLEATYGYMPQWNELFIVNVKNSDFDMQTGGHQVGLKATYNTSFGILNTNLSYNYMNNSRTNSAINQKFWRYSATDKNWNPNGVSQGEGGYGNVDTTQQRANFKSNFEFNAFNYKFMDNKINAGIELGYVNAFYERKEDSMFGSLPQAAGVMKAGEICTDLNWCSNAVVDVNKLNNNLKNAYANNNGQFIHEVALYKAGKINLSNFDMGIFIEDSMKFDLGLNNGEINARFGLRLDYDTYMNKAPIAPRFSMNYEAPWNVGAGRNFATQFSFGYNRYYGRNLFAFALQDGRNALQYRLRRTSETTTWDNATRTQYKNLTDFEQLKVPYADELMGGIVQRFYMFDISAKYIHRFGRDEIKRGCFDASGNPARTCSTTDNPNASYWSNMFRYTNDGSSQTDVVTLSITNNNRIETFGVRHHYLFAFDWTNVKRNYEDYDMSATEFLTDIANEIISWNGQFIRFANRPATNFVRPWTLRFNMTHSYKVWRTNITWNNFFRFRSGYQVMANVTNDADKDIYEGAPVETFRPFDVKGAFTWDMRLGVDIDLHKGNSMYVNLDIFNVLNNANLMIVSASFSGSATTAVPVYEIGRQFWLQAGYRF